MQTLENIQKFNAVWGKAQACCLFGLARNGKKVFKVYKVEAA
jgi:hypothetical protein